MTLEPCAELDRLEDAISKNTKWIIGVLLGIMIPVAAGSIKVYAQVSSGEKELETHVRLDDARALAASEVAKRQADVRETLSGMVATQKAQSTDIDEIKDTLKENRLLLESIHKEMRR